jgi:hypothetical protein
MSPKSRGRKRKNNSAARRERSRERRVPTVLDLVDAPAWGYDLARRGGDLDVEAIVDPVLEVAAPLMSAADPLEAEVSAAALLGTIGLVSTPPEIVDIAQMQTLTGEFIPAIETRASDEAMALLTALGTVAPRPVDAASAAAADRLASVGIARPPWAVEAGAPVTVGECRAWQPPDEPDAGSILLASFTRAERHHTLLVFVDALDCGAATRIMLLDNDKLPELERSFRGPHPEWGEQDGTSQALVETALEPAEWRWQAEIALDARTVHDQDEATFDPGRLRGDAEMQEPSEDPAMPLLLRARLQVMPASPKPKPPHGGRSSQQQALPSAHPPGLDEPR